MAKKEVKDVGTTKAADKSYDTGRKKCFFVTPIGKAGSSENKKMNAVLDNILKPVCEEKGYKVTASNKIDDTGSITAQIITELVESDLVIVDLTNANPNVMYELGVRHSFSKPCIAICDNSTTLPFDIADERTIFFDDSIEGTGNLMEELTRKIDSITEDGTTDSPISRVIKRGAILNSVSGNDDDKLSVLIEMMRDFQANMEENRTLKSSLNDITPTVKSSTYDIGNSVQISFNSKNGNAVLIGKVTAYSGVNFSNINISKRIMITMMEVKDNLELFGPGDMIIQVVRDQLEKETGIMFTRKSIMDLLSIFEIDR